MAAKDNIHDRNLFRSYSLLLFLLFANQ